jgi:hypothetical protein
MRCLSLGRGLAARPADVGGAGLKKRASFCPGKQYWARDKGPPWYVVEAASRMMVVALVLPRGNGL